VVLTRRFMKETIAVGTRRQLIATVKFRRCPTGDSSDFVRVSRKVQGFLGGGSKFGVKFTYIVQG